MSDHHSLSAAGEWCKGSTSDFGSEDCRFESCLPSQFTHHIVADELLKSQEANKGFFQLMQLLETEPIFGRYEVLEKQPYTEDSGSNLCVL